MISDKTWILGPCSLENHDLFFSVMDRVYAIMDPSDSWIMKASFDKANRTSLHGGRGPGLEYAKEV